MTPIKLSIIILEYHSLDDVRQCLATLRGSLHGISHEIIISSNSCYTATEQEKIMKQETDVRWTFNPRNGGFSYGMNQGMRRAEGEYLLVINPDVQMLTSLEPLIAFMDANPEVGAAGPKIVGHKGQVQDSCRPYVSLPSLLSRTCKRVLRINRTGLTDTFDYDLTQTVDWVIGAFILVRADIFRTTGGMDEAYFMYAEDLDWCTRIRQLGSEIVYFPEMCIEFEGSRHARRELKYLTIFVKSHLRFWRKFGFCGGYPKRREIAFQS